MVTLGLCMMAACGEDRSLEQPFAPEVETAGVTVNGQVATFTGYVLASPNSSLRECGFAFGNDTLRSVVKAAQPADTFTVQVDSMKAGEYFMAAYATNGVGTTYGDTLYFTVE